METVKKTDLEDQKQDIIQETKKIKKEVTIDAEHSTTSIKDTGTLIKSSKMVSLGQKLAASLNQFRQLTLCKKVLNILGNILGIILWIICVLPLIIFIIGVVLFIEAVIVTGLYGLMMYIYGLDNILSIICWVPFLSIIVILGIVLMWKILEIGYVSVKPLFGFKETDE